MANPNEQFTYKNATHLHVQAPHRPAQLTQPHNLKGVLKSMSKDPSKAIFGVGQGIPSVFLSKVLGQAGADFVWLDGEHSLWDRSTIYDAVHAIHHHSEGKTMVIVRVPENDETFLTAALDAGADGILLPHTESAEELQKLAEKVYYPPKGKRSFSPWTFAPGVTGHSIFPNDIGNLQTSNNHTAIIAQVESVKGIENLEEICSSEFIDCLLFGPGDFRADAGLSVLPTSPNLEPIFVDAIAKVAKTAAAHKIVTMGAAIDFSQLPTILKSGAQVIMVLFDYWFLTQNVSKMVTEGHTLVEELAKDQKE